MVQLVNMLIMQTSTNKITLGMSCMFLTKRRISYKNMGTQEKCITQALLCNNYKALLINT